MKTTKKTEWIVFEGLDKSGKTTLSRMLAAKRNCIYLKGICSPTPFGRLAGRHPVTVIFLLELVWNLFRMYGLRQKGKTIIQDRYLFSVACHLPVTRRCPHRQFIYIARLFMPKPDVLIYCTADKQERLRRICTQSEINVQEKWLVEHPEWIDGRDRAYEELYRSFRGKKLKIDTTRLSPAEAYRILSSFI